METSPGGNTIERVTGAPEDIINRGQAVIDLGQMMVDSAELLDSIKNRATDGGEMTGQAINALKDVIGDSYEQLREAGDLYKPVGPVIKRYGEALDRLQPLIEAVVAECESLWTTYDNTPDPGSRPADYSTDSDVAAVYDQRVADLESAREEWETKAAEFDRLYNGDCDSWEYVFDQAVAGIGTAMSGQIKDSWWDKHGHWLDKLVSVLEIAGLIVGILALIFAGPFAAIALGIAFAVLAVRAVQMFDDTKSWGERFGNLGWAVVGVLPFGKFGDIKAGRTSFVSATFEPFTTFGSQVDQLRNVRTVGDLWRNGNPDGLWDLGGRVVMGGDANSIVNMGFLPFQIAGTQGQHYDMVTGGIGAVGDLFG